jgi:hypothetical protein
MRLKIFAGKQDFERQWYGHLPHAAMNRLSGRRAVFGNTLGGLRVMFADADAAG